MGFWVFMLAMVLLIPASMAGFGAVFMHRPPAKISATFGYRTAASMRNQDSWRFAHRYCGKIWLWLGLALAPASAVAFWTVLGKNSDTIGLLALALVALQLGAMVSGVLLTERALKRASVNWN